MPDIVCWMRVKKFGWFWRVVWKERPSREREESRKMVAEKAMLAAMRSRETERVRHMEGVEEGGYI